MVRAGLLQKRIEIIGNFDHGLIWVFRQDEIDGHSGRASVMGDQPPGNFSRVQRDPLNSGHIGIAQCRCVLNERRDDQIVLKCFAVGIVGKGVDATGIRRAPRSFGQFLNRAKRLAGEHRTLARRNGNQGRIGDGVRVL